MKQVYVVLVIFSFMFNVCLCIETKANLTSANNTASSPTTESTKGDASLTTYFSKNIGPLKRAFYVFIGVTAIVAVYLGIRVYRSRKRKVKSYGLLSSTGENMELNQLNSDSDDDYTVFEAKPIY